jgi:DNA-binding response OmpR family regulator
MKTRILIVEDDPHIRFGLEELLRAEGYEVAVCERGDQALAAVSRHRPALVVLDVMLPGLSGYDVCKELRSAQVNVRILMLTAKGQELDKVIGLDLGADDYLTKPFGLRELIARVRALLRRQSDTNEACSFQIGESVIDPRRLSITRSDTEESLTARELKLLQLFHRHPGEVLSRDRLLNEGWGINYYGTTRTLDQVIVQIRRKLGDNGSEPRLLLTVHGVGYKLVP